MFTLRLERRRLAAFLLTLLLLPPAGLAEGLPDLGEAAEADLPPVMAQRIGQAIFNEYRVQPEFIDDPEVIDYINQLGQRLVDKSSEARFPFEFFVLRDASLNAFAMPGGYIGVHTGLIQAAQTESELAGVLAHEVSHVTQRHLARLFNKQNQMAMPMLVAMAAALLAARNNSSVAVGGIAAAQAATIQTQLSYSRDFEREADRIGLNLLESAGFDVRGMEGFFERLQKFGRLYENNAPGYLRTHPLTSERLSDMGNRIQDKPKRKVADSIEFALVKGKLRATDGAARDAVADFNAMLKEKTDSSEIGLRFGLAHAQLRVGNLVAAAQALAELRRLKAVSVMVDLLAAQLTLKQGNLTNAEAQIRQALQRYPQSRAASYALTELLLGAGRNEAAMRHINADLQLWPNDAQLYLLQARTYAASGKRLQQHWAQAEAYTMRGQLRQAVEQLLLAQKSPDGDFFEYSQVEAKLRELKQKLADESKNKI